MNVDPGIGQSLLDGDHDLIAQLVSRAHRHAVVHRQVEVDEAGRAGLSASEGDGSCGLPASVL